MLANIKIETEDDRKHVPIPLMKEKEKMKNKL
jgi:hypothetical protein